MSNRKIRSGKKKVFVLFFVILRVAQTTPAREKMYIYVKKIKSTDSWLEEERVGEKKKSLGLRQKLTCPLVCG